MSLALRSCLVLGLLATSACGQEVRFTDSIDLTFDLFRQSDALHTPYVVGAEFRVCADALDDHALSGMTLRSSDDSTLELGLTDENEDGDRLCTSATARAAGEVEILVMDADDEVASALVEVRAPDRVELYAAGPLLVDRDDLDPRVDRPKVLAGGTATFEVRYFDGDTRLHGQGALVVRGGADVRAEAVGTVVFEDREWLRLTPSEEGEHELGLATPAGDLPPVRIDVVSEDAIADVSLHGGDEGQRSEGDPMVVYAQAYDEDDAPIYGVEYEWSLGGVPEPGTGDLFRYDLDLSQRNELTAHLGELDATAQIHAGEGEVDSSNEIGCTIGGRRGGPWALLMLVAGIAARRRRKAAA
ncbi:hypothetical protein [Paraliomyxa miuraensis]|uniref:hypothetical protein n=1 Tax=Paraliomyxa miuraensis TaxID=376150 RepID=UPI0022581265|nr:hypothetical protein [Paraliomyxa miuraensis]MCX4240236.1 hypothetical protein [Paraliomyxa miuraensis]